jgi:hypothetical protein
MRRLAVVAVLFVSTLVPAATVAASAMAGTASASSAPQLVAFRGFHLGGGRGFGRRYSGFGGLRRRGSSHALRRIAHALVFAYFLHLFFSHGGLSILLWLLVIGLVVHFLRRSRRRRRRYA